MGLEQMVLREILYPEQGHSDASKIHNLLRSSIHSSIRWGKMGDFMGLISAVFGVNGQQSQPFLH